MPVRSPRDRVRVLHTPAAVGGHATQLAEAERALGLDSVSVSLHAPPYGYTADEVLFGPRTRPLARERRRWLLVRRALREFDVVHFNFGSSLAPVHHPAARQGLTGAAYGLYARALELRDVPLLARRGTKIFVTYQGDDVRPTGAALGLERTPAELARDRRKERAALVFDRYAERIYALNPDLLRYLPARAEFLPYASVDLAAWSPVGVRRHDGPPVVVHAPTDRAVKGTAALVDAVERLRRTGLELELVLVEGVSREDARREYERADLLVDQLFTGWYGSVAVELMALGKPVVAHLRADDLERIPRGMREQLPVIDATATTIESVLAEWLAQRRAELGEVGARGRAYVERWHDPLTVAARTKAAYEEALRVARR